MTWSGIHKFSFTILTSKLILIILWYLCQVTFDMCTSVFHISFHFLHILYKLPILFWNIGSHVAHASLKFLLYLLLPLKYHHEKWRWSWRSVSGFFEWYELYDRMILTYIPSLLKLMASRYFEKWKYENIYHI